MSGFKRATVTISEQEYRRLHEVDMIKWFVRKNMGICQLERQMQPMGTPVAVYHLCTLQVRQPNMLVRVAIGGVKTEESKHEMNESLE